MRIRKPLERWFPVENDPDNARILIKHLLPGEIQDISDVTFTQEVEYGASDEDGKLKPVIKQKNDRKTDREKTLVARVQNWENIFDADGAPLPFSKENVIRASREIDGFVEYVKKCADTLADDIANENKAQEKNS